MKISNTLPQHLSYREVLDHFIALKQETDALGEAIALKKARNKAQMKARFPLERDDPEKRDDPALLEEITEEEEEQLQIAARRGASDELVWITDEVIGYLCSDLVPTSLQTLEGISQLADELQDHQLTKAEVLQMCNLAPSEPVTLYSIIEEADTRFYPDPAAKLDEIGNQIYATLLPTPPEELLPYMPALAEEQAGEGFEPGYVEGDADAEMEMAMMAEEYVTETGKEGGVDDDADEAMD
ncbi:hypothetical protein L202_00752 [Cryptococcus amylolentus CBS 6039]|uniref:DNA-directed RNA polymerase III subunit RPC9 n=2 Tax=Cryptococcus amylolentus TaxID=104669 RepID=A0A1E3I8F5_9TREE|nr:hypothetical protein L202_00752 [Cryptococcus amylolentus CBS 6039]ODN84900.1 hypothetical protein L202_00752 [Cryptococcus amylolentus CBS 6039]ODO11393.1 hypothetical protein I350_00172 [Cryptococcus amylolentus CBS 6273]